MALDLAWWQARLELLQEMSTEGILTKEHDSAGVHKRLTYKNNQELFSAIRYAESQVDRLSGTTRTMSTRAHWRRHA